MVGNSNPKERADSAARFRMASRWSLGSFAAARDERGRDDAIDGEVKVNPFEAVGKANAKPMNVKDFE